MSDPGAATGGPLPEALRDPFATAMAQSMLLPAAVLVIGFVAVACFATPRHLVERRAAAERTGSAESLTR